MTTKTMRRSEIETVLNITIRSVGAPGDGPDALVTQWICGDCLDSCFELAIDDGEVVVRQQTAEDFGWDWRAAEEVRTARGRGVCVLLGDEPAHCVERRGVGPGGVAITAHAGVRPFDSAGGRVQPHRCKIDSWTTSPPPTSPADSGSRHRPGGPTSPGRRPRHRTRPSARSISGVPRRSTPGSALGAGGGGARALRRSARADGSGARDAPCAPGQGHGSTRAKVRSISPESQSEGRQSRTW